MCLSFPSTSSSSKAKKRKSNDRVGGVGEGASHEGASGGESNEIGKLKEKMLYAKCE
jgi:hypothetical protein